MNVGIYTYTPYVILLDMPIMEYLRYEQMVTEKIEKAVENR